MEGIIHRTEGGAMEGIIHRTEGGVMEGENGQ